MLNKIKNLVPSKYVKFEEAYDKYGYEDMVIVNLVKEDSYFLLAYDDEGYFHLIDEIHCMAWYTKDIKEVAKWIENYL